MGKIYDWSQIAADDWQEASQRAAVIRSLVEVRPLLTRTSAGSLRRLVGTDRYQALVAAFLSFATKSQGAKNMDYFCRKSMVRKSVIMIHICDKSMEVL